MFSSAKRFFSNNKPNLIYRKSKVTGKTIEQLLLSRVPIPKFKEEALFGVYPVLESLETSKRRFHRLWIKDSLKERANDDQRLSRIIQLTVEKNIPINRITQAQLDRITDFQLHNGICLDASPLPFASLSSCRLSLFLDGVLDPQNIGAIVRSSLVFGVGQAIYCKGRGPSLITNSMSKASAGSIERLNIVQLEQFAQLQQELSNVFLIGTSDPESAKRYGKDFVDLEDITLPETKQIVLVLGDEHKGISPEIMTQCDQFTAIKGSSSNTGHISSLNVSVAAGILFRVLSHKLKL